MRFLATQTGARRGYAVPRILHDAGLLERFYTDLAGNTGAGRWISKLTGESSRLSGRKIPEEILAKTTSFATPALTHLIRSRLGKNNPEAFFRRQLSFSEAWGRAMIRKGFGDATHLYSMLNECGPFLGEAKSRGLTVVSEIYILLSTERIVQAEQKRFPEWEPNAPDYAALRRKYLPEDTFPRNIDLCLCPSSAVQEDLVRHWNIPAERTCLVPYGMSPHWLELETNPEPGRILFVGTADLRKGIHYLAMAAEQLRRSGHRYEFRVAGHVTEAVRSRPECRHLTFLGRVPRDRIHEEFARADLFVLPSLAEGSAEVTYEALAAGVPQIVTPATGSVARDGIDGIVVPERDYEALVGAIEQGVSDRVWREGAAQASRELAREFTWEMYGRKLVEMLMTCP